jgi:hypothetical protein
MLSTTSTCFSNDLITWFFCRICASKYSRLLEAETNAKSELDDAGEKTRRDEDGKKHWHHALNASSHTP